jgi:hypothetical protein
VIKDGGGVQVAPPFPGFEIDFLIFFYLGGGVVPGLVMVSSIFRTGLNANSSFSECHDCLHPALHCTVRVPEVFCELMIFYLFYYLIFDISRLDFFTSHSTHCRLYLGKFLMDQSFNSFVFQSRFRIISQTN